MRTEGDIDLLERYFDNELSASETQTVQDRLESDKEFRDMFDQEKALIKSIRASGLRRDLLHLKEVEQRIHTHGAGGQDGRIRPWYYAAAAAVALLVVAGVWQIRPQETPEQLFQAYFVPVTNVFETTRRGAESSGRPIAYQYYDAQNYRMAADMFGQLLEDNQKPELLLLSANANLAIGNTSVAREHLTTLIRDYDEMDMPAKWYLSLCYLKEGDIVAAKAVLEELEQTQVSYTSKAKALLKEMN